MKRPTRVERRVDGPSPPHSETPLNSVLTVQISAKIPTQILRETSRYGTTGIPQGTKGTAYCTTNKQP